MSDFTPTFPIFSSKYDVVTCNFDNYESMASLIHQSRFGTTEKDLGRKFGVICNLPGVLKV